MGKLNDIDFAIIETLKKHQEFIPLMNSIYMHSMTSEEGIDLTNFTSNNSARAKMKEVTQTDMLHFILRETVKSYNAIVYYYYNDPNMKVLTDVQQKMSTLLNTFSYFGVLQKAVGIIANPKLNSAIFYQSNPKDLMALVDAVINCRYQRGEKLRGYIDKAGQGLTTVKDFGTKDLHTIVDEDIKKAEVAKNFKVNPQATNQCLLDVTSGSQLKHKHNEYGLNGTLFATQDVGNKRKNQEDAVLILEHPDNPDFKLIAVSDGMGGVALGDKASSYVTQQLANWFKNIPADLYGFPADVQKGFNRILAQISTQIYNDYNAAYKGLRAGATVAASIVTKDYTINSSVGDSRIYTIRDNQMTLITRDESAVWPPSRDPKDMTPAEIDDLRFRVNNNQITNCMGFKIGPNNIQTSIIPNTSYEKLIILSDGVTDLLSQETIKVISRTYPVDQITHELVKAALSYDAVRVQGEDPIHFDRVEAGKDNATAAMYVRR